MSGARGPLSTPQAERELTGNPGKRQTPASALDSAPVERPPRPKHLEGEARAEWNRVTRELLRQRRLAKTDRALLAAYCSAWAELVEAQDELAEHGSVSAGQMGQPVVSPWFKNVVTLRAEVKNLSAQLGLNVAARARLPAVPKAEEVDPADELRARREAKRQGAAS